MYINAEENSVIYTLLSIIPCTFAIISENLKKMHFVVCIIRNTRSRSELIREAARMYIEKKRKWESIFAYGESLSSRYKFTEEDVNEEIRKYRQK